MRILLDNNVIDKLKGYEEIIIKHTNIQLFVCHEAILETCANRNRNLIDNIESLLAVKPVSLNNPIFVLGHSKLDGKSLFGDDKTTDAYYKILNKNRNNISDAIIAACAVKNDCILMTNDRSLHNKMLKNRYSVISFQEFIKIIEQP